MRRGGFTLLETMIALAITALVLAALGEAVLRTAAARTRATSVADRTSAARTVLLLLAREIEAAVPPAAPGAAMESERFVVDPPPAPDASSVLRFAAMGSAAAAGASDLQTLAYVREAHPEQRGSGTLVRRTAAVDPQTVLTGIRRFRVRCFDGTAWRDAWPPGPLPRAVEVELDLEDGAGGVTSLATTTTVAAATR